MGPAHISGVRTAEFCLSPRPVDPRLADLLTAHDALREPVIVVADSGTVLGVNASAEALFAGGDIPPRLLEPPADPVASSDAVTELRLGDGDQARVYACRFVRAPFAEAWLWRASDVTVWATRTQHATSQAVAASEARLRGVLESGFDAFVLARAVREADGRIVDFAILDVNTRATQLVAVPRDRLIGASLFVAFPRSLDWGLWEQCCRVVITREPLEATQYAPLADQPVRWLQRQLVPVDPDSVAISSRDITAQQIERLRLEESEVRHRQLFENNGAIQLLADVESAAIVDVNPAAEVFYGWPRTLMRTMFVTDLESVALEHWRELTASLAVGTGLRVQRTHRVASGELRQIEAFIGVAAFAPRRVLHIIIQDISDRVRAERQLRESEERLRQAQKLEAVAQLAGVIAHDFNNLLTVIRGATTFLRDALAGQAGPLDDVAAIDRATDRAEELTRRLVAVGRRQMLRAEEVELNALLDDQLPILREDVPITIGIKLALSPTPVLASLDRTRLLDALRALVDNARDAMPSGGMLTLATAHATVVHPHDIAVDAAPRQFAVLSVHDTGHGMRDEIRARLFEPFFSTQPFGTNRGMGLASVHGMVHQSRGFIECDSTPELGTAIRLFFPSAGAPVSRTPAVGVDVVDARPGGVLLVDDDAMLRDLARRMLEKIGEVVYVVESGVDALTFLDARVGDVSLVLTDLTMPGMSGLELIDELVVRYPMLPIAAISGYVVDPDARARLDARGVAFLPKPFAVPDLARLLANVRR